MLIAAAIIAEIVVTLLVIIMTVCILIGALNPWGKGLETAGKGVGIFFLGIFILGVFSLILKGCAN